MLFLPTPCSLRDFQCAPERMFFPQHRCRKSPKECQIPGKPVNPFRDLIKILRSWFFVLMQDTANHSLWRLLPCQFASIRPPHTCMLCHFTSPPIKYSPFSVRLSLPIFLICFGLSICSWFSGKNFQEKISKTRNFPLKV